MRLGHWDCLLQGQRSYIFNNSEINAASLNAQRLNSFLNITALVQGPQMWLSQGSGPDSKCSEAVEVWYSY